MAGRAPVPQSEQEGTQRGLLFRLSVGLGGIAFAAVLALGVSRAADPTQSLLQALAALSVFSVCGWAAEQVVQYALSKRAAEAARAVVDDAVVEEPIEREQAA